MKLISVFFISLLLSGCSHNAVVIGTYSSKSNPDFFQFNEDSTYTYKYAAYHLHEYSSGKWIKAKKNTIILNSSIQSKEIPLDIHQGNEKYNTESRIDISFNTDLALKNYKCVIFINDTLYSFKEADTIAPTELSWSDFNQEVNIDDIYFRYISCDSLSTMKVNTPIESIFFKIMKFDSNSNYLIRNPLKTEKYVFHSPNKHNLKIKLSFTDSLFNFRIFKNERLKIGKKGLYFFNENNHDWWYVPKLFSNAQL